MLAPPKPRTRRLTIIAQDPSIRVDGRILTAEVEIPAEEIAPGPRGYRVNVIDYDTSTGTLYIPLDYDPLRDGHYPDPFKQKAERANNDWMLDDPRFHAQNVYAIVMRTLARFEFALGRRVSWGFYGHQIFVAPHAFADANAFYSERDRALMFGYFSGHSDTGKTPTIYSCLSHDVVAHETTHALLDGLRKRYTDPSSPEQAGFHEGFADVVALLSVFSLPDIVASLLDYHHREQHKNAKAPAHIDPEELTPEKLRKSVLLGMAKQMGQEMSGGRGNRADALRRSVMLKPLTSKDDPDKYEKLEEFKEPHRRGEILVAAMLNAFLEVWLVRVEKLKHGKAAGSKLDRELVVEEGANAANHLLTMAIRALDYAPPTDLQFCDFLSAALTADRELMPDDNKYHYRKILRDSFKNYGLEPPTSTDGEGAWKMVDPGAFTYDRAHFESMMRDPDEVFRFLWENREPLQLHDGAYTEVQSVRPCLRIGPDGFALRETVAEYIQMISLQARELEMFNINIPEGMSQTQEVTLYGGGALIFDEYGRLKFHVRNRIMNPARQTPRLKYLWEFGYFSRKSQENFFARMHMQRAANLRTRVSEEF
ncbi:MAG TPA: hypothetical protein VJT82_06960 [Pyrinomonadaceae bacterium]|nr:hypothetical protein [Pyrinomonadaceae bacterium]